MKLEISALGTNLLPVNIMSCNAILDNIKLLSTLSSTVQLYRNFGLLKGRIRVSGKQDYRL